MIKTERLKLREWQESDAPDLFELSMSENIAMAGAKIHESVDESIECILS